MPRKLQLLNTGSLFGVVNLLICLVLMAQLLGDQGSVDMFA